MKARSHSVEAVASCSDCSDRDPARDYEAFETALPRLLDEHAGKYALVARGQVLQIEDSFTRACHAGYDSDLGPDFLVLKIAENQGIRTSLILS